MYVSIHPVRYAFEVIEAQHGHPSFHWISNTEPVVILIDPLRLISMLLFYEIVDL